MIACDPATTMRAFAMHKTGELTESMADALNAAAADPSADPVHDMRVSIRRLQQGLRLFRQFLPAKALKEIRRTMKHVMDHAGELRNYDIAIELAQKAKHPLPELAERRAAAQAALSAVLAEVAAPDLAIRWKTQLKLDRAS